MYAKLPSVSFIFMFLIGEIGLNQQTQTNLLDVLRDYQGEDGNELITPIKVINEVYASNKPFLLAMLHLSFSELFQNVRIWASLNNENTVLVQPRSDSLMLETANALEQAEEDGDKAQLETSLTNKNEMLNNLF